MAGADATPRATLESVAPTLTYYVGSVAVGAGSTVPPARVGTYTAVADFAASADYTAATSAPVTFTITRATPAISWAAPADIVYGTAIGGLELDAASPVPGAFTYSAPAGTILDAGRGQAIAVTFTPGDTTDYNEASATVRINVLPAPLTIRAADASKIAGQPDPADSAMYSGFVLGQGPAALSGTLSFSTTADASSPAGSYPIIPGGLSSANYTIIYTSGTLDVAPPLVSITGVGWQTVKLGRHKPTTVLVVSFSGAIDPGRATALSGVAATPAARGKKTGAGHAQTIALRSAKYNPATNCVTLTPARPVPNATMQITINATAILDAEGRPIESQPGPILLPPG